jgi:O-antigen/teichoic acid export membrane protein
MGAFSAQIVTLICMPVLSRLYEPEDIGIYNLIYSAVTILTIFLSFGLHQALPLAENLKEFKSIEKWIVIFSFFNMIVSYFLILIFNEYLYQLLNLKEGIFYLYLIPIVTSLSLFAMVKDNQCFWNSKFKVQSKVHFFQSVLNNFLKIFFGLFVNSVLFLVLATTASYVFKIIAISKEYNKRFSIKLLMLSEWKIIDFSVLLKYIDFPKFRFPQMFINSLSQHLPILILGIFYGSKQAGYYGLAVMALSFPVNLIGNSLYNVLYPKFSKLHNKVKSQIYYELKKFTILLISASIFPGIFVIFSSPFLFKIIFGQKWIMAGEYTRWLAINYALMLISRPSIAIIPIISMNKNYLIFEIFGTVLKILSLSIGVCFIKHDLQIVIIYSMTSAFVYFALILWVFCNAKSKL